MLSSLKKAIKSPFRKFFFIVFLCLGLFLSPTSAEEINLQNAGGLDKEFFQGQNQEFSQFNHVFWIRTLPTISQTSYLVKAEEILRGSSNPGAPAMRILGNIILRSPVSAKACMVRLPASQIKAVNRNTGNAVVINLKGRVGNEPLSTEFVRPAFDESLLVPFEIEGYLEAGSLRGLEPGVYSYGENLNLIVEFSE
jgi:hypothetical protein